MNEGAAPSGLADAVLAGFRRAVSAAEAVAADIAAATDRAAALYEAGGRLIYVGAGASGLIAAEDAAELPGTFGLDPTRIVKMIAGGEERPFEIRAEAEDDRRSGAEAIAALGLLASSVVVAVSASGATPYTLAAAEAARRSGAYLIAVACRSPSPLLSLGDSTVFLDSGEEALMGSTRLAAGASQKCALGLFSTLLGERLGHIHAGRMINLKAENDKLRRRALAIVTDLSGADEIFAARALRLADGDVKGAILIASGASDRNEAARRLNGARGRLQPALEALRRERPAG